EIQAIPVETPGQFRIAGEPAWVGEGYKIESQLLIGRVSAPQPLRAAKVRQAGIDSHAGAGANEKGVRRGDCRRSSLKIRMNGHSVQLTREPGASAGRIPRSTASALAPGSRLNYLLARCASR